MAKRAALLLLATASSGVSAITAADKLGIANGMSPVTRVVELLQGLNKQMEQDHKNEEDLYETYVCWAKSIMSQKQRTNAAAQARVDTLTEYITDLDAGRIELTTERVDLEKEMKEVTQDLETMKQIEDQRKLDFQQAKTEMDAAIAALTDAIGVLETATQDHKDGVLLSVKGQMGATHEVREQQAARLQRVIDLGKKVLGRGDEVFLQRLLTGDSRAPPKRASWKKLNRKATFKMDYKARSFKIQDTLGKLLETFNDDLSEATKKDTDAAAEYAKLKTGKEAEKAAVTTALQKMEKETGARFVSREDAVNEKTDLETQITNDKGYITQVQTSLAQKKSEWGDRQKLRSDEMEAISKAISILHGDDARDTFKRSFTSQGYSLLQIDNQASNAAKVLKATALQSHNSKIAALAQRAKIPSAFTDVLTAIDSMITDLRTEEQDDLTTKETCESDRATDTREAIVKARAMDELTETNQALAAKVKELTAEIEDKEAQVVVINKELADALKERTAEHAEYLKNKKDDADAAVLVENAKNVIQQFYTDNGLMLAQQPAISDFKSVAGEAPPPPPATWEKPYGGKADEGAGIIAIMEMIHSDILADEADADAADAEAKALYDKTKLNLETERGELQSAIGDLTIQKATAEGDIQLNEGTRETKRGELKVIMKRIADAKPNCDFFLINYPLRVSNRHIEIDGLEKAKAILSGGTFDGLPDPDREIKPGDALVQARGKFLHRKA